MVGIIADPKGARFAIREIHYFQFRRLIKLLPNRLDVGSVWDQTCIHQHQLLYLIITKTKAEQLSQGYTSTKIVKKFPELKHTLHKALLILFSPNLELHGFSDHRFLLLSLQHQLLPDNFPYERLEKQ
ncbi:unnamed protein product [Brassica oleracea var. botrytis]|uniref:(rape) hypothetical protein n=1 Tax=Brassica napus TaxID=3708 RepID=A0A816UA16_BRANA|nr:unnamed protein product [Brassica napus]